eukprot:gene13777-13560_t
MISFTSADINLWIAGLLWPLTRILGLIAAAPLFGNSAIPATVKVCLGVLLAMVVAPVVPAAPAADPLSLAGLLIVVQEMLIGLAMGFSIRIVFAAVEMAGEISSLTMGLGFATFFDPTTQGRSSAISQFLALVTTMLFLAVNAHLVLLSALVESFYSLPISASPVYGGGFKQMADWDMQALNSEQMSVMSSTQVRAITTLQLNALNTTALVGLATENIPNLTLQQVGALSSSLFATLSTDQLVALSTREMQVLTSQQLNVLNSDQVAALETHDVRSLSSDQFSTLGSDQVSALSTDQLATLGSQRER